MSGISEIQVGVTVFLMMQLFYLVGLDLVLAFATQL